MTSRHDSGKVIFEGNCLSVINLLSVYQNNPADISTFIHDIFHSSATLDCSFGFVPRIAIGRRVC